MNQSKSFSSNGMKIVEVSPVDGTFLPEARTGESTGMIFI